MNRVRAWVWVALLAVGRVEVRAEETRLDDLASAPVVAEVELVRVVETTREERILQVRVLRQAGLVTLPPRLHFIVPDADWNTRRGPPPWYAMARSGKKVRLAVHVSRDGYPWSPGLGSDTPDWKDIETVYRIRARLATSSPGERRRQLEMLIVSKQFVERCAAVADLSFDRWNPPPEVVALVGRLQPERLPAAWTNRYSGKFYEAFVRSWQKRRTAELVEEVREPVSDHNLWQYYIAQTALVRKTAAGDDEAIAYWLGVVRGHKKPAEVCYLLLDALGEATRRRDVREMFITLFEKGGGNFGEDVKLLACILVGGKEGFDYAADCLTGKRQPPAAKEFTAEGLRWFFEILGDKLGNPDGAARSMELLSERNPMARAFAAHILGLVRHAPAAKRLNALFDDPHESPYVRLVAALALLRMEDRIALAFSRKVLAQKEPVVIRRCRIFRNESDSDHPIAAHAIGRLGDIHCPESVALLERALQSGRHDLAHYAGNALARHHSPEAMRALQKHYRTATREAETLGAITLLAAQNTPEGWAFVRRVAEEKGRLTWVLQAVRSDARRTAQVLDDYYRRVRARRSEEMLGEIGRLIADLDADRFRVREQATKRLAGLGLAALPELADTSIGPPREPSERARGLLARLRTPEEERLLVTGLLRCRERRLAPLLVDLLASTDPSVRVMAAEGLAALTGKPLDFDPLAGDDATYKAVQRWRRALASPGQ